MTRGGVLGKTIASILGLPEESTPAQLTKVNLDVLLNSANNNSYNSPNDESWVRQFNGKKYRYYLFINLIVINYID